MPSVDAEAPHSLTDRETVTAAPAHSGPRALTNEVINDLMSLFTHSPTEILGRSLFHQGCSPVTEAFDKGPDCLIVLTLI